jgi:tripartite motif-containing protein 71
LSFNQPKLCPNASWDPEGILFSTAVSEPFGLFVHISNAVYATEQETAQLQVWSSQGGIPTETISYYLNNPGAIFVTLNGDIYVDNGNNFQVLKWISGATSAVDVMNVTAQCLGLFIDTNNTLYCSASQVHQVLAQSLNVGIYPVEIVAGSDTYGSAANQLTLPNGIFIDINFNLYVADYWNSRVQKFMLGESNAQTVAGNGVLGSEDLNGPIAVVLDADNYLFITDMDNNRVIGSGPNGFRCLVGCSETSGSLVNQFNGPRSLGFDSYGNLFVADRENDRILKFILATNSCGMFNRYFIEAMKFRTCFQLYLCSESCYNLNFILFTIEI